VYNKINGNSAEIAGVDNIGGYVGVDFAGVDSAAMT